MMVLRGGGTVCSSERMLPTSSCRVDRHDGICLKEGEEKKMKELTMTARKNR